MICSYDKSYLECAQTSLGLMFDFGVHELHYSLMDFAALFLESDISERFQVGDVSVLAGRSGIELAYDIMLQNGQDSILIEPIFPDKKSSAYWTGWALAYYQWCSNKSFAQILSIIPIDTIQNLYTPYHEMDIRQFVDKMNELYSKAQPDTNLKKLRQDAGFTQQELADLAEIPLRTLQQYEQRQKNINRARAEYIIRLSKYLSCSPDRLME